ncbi:zinc-binding dehydrogenase [Polaromonas sp.]|jgi:NADPH:quinone reductase-like Zn-dependent oxidoreductase|uniref:zinc-binding dehydrogenase n=1 Tax=Polaromonas sp. TaxID=1869339 RepID=UPI002BC13BFF|nr:zinc-binding dehydrogenase [Polaromonas sp.]HQS30880.1 zinc-binding dehydrogenase [Polaromonas sp.]HQS92419.1 zinc-binding dehydrogenase [Polaromonas sp.]
MQSYWMQMSDTDATLDLRDVPQPQPGAGQVLVRLHAAALNRGEFILGHGLHGKPGSAKAIGMEGAGEVVAVGAAVTTLKPGDRVMGRCPAAFSDYAVMDVREAMRVPAALSWEEAASVPLTFLVVHDMLVLQGRLAAGEWLLINGVSSGVGVAALQMAKALGAKVIGTSGSADKLARLKPLGLDVALCTRSADFHDDVMQATGGKGVNLVVNTVGGSVFAENVRCAAFEGRLATVGYVDGMLKAEIDIEALHARRLTLFGVSNKLRTPDQRAQSLPAFVADVLPALAEGRIKPLVDRVFPFAELAAAKACMEANQHLGKIVLKTAA